MNIYEKELKKIIKKEEAFIKDRASLSSMLKTAQFNEKVLKKIPETLIATLNEAFYRGFEFIVEKQSGIVKQTANNKKNSKYDLTGKRQLKRLDKNSDRGKFLKSGLTFIEGTGLGLLGIGLPDIPLFCSLLLRGVYEQAAHYGYSCASRQEKYYALMLIEAALSDNNKTAIINRQIDEFSSAPPEKMLRIYTNKQIKNTSTALTNALLIAKFVQGLPFVGAVGGITNLSVYNKVIEFSSIKYKKRFLLNKLL